MTRGSRRWKEPRAVADRDTQWYRIRFCYTYHAIQHKMTTKSTLPGIHQMIQTLAKRFIAMHNSSALPLQRQSSTQVTTNPARLASRTGSTDPRLQPRSHPRRRLCQGSLDTRRRRRSPARLGSRFHSSLRLWGCQHRSTQPKEQVPTVLVIIVVNVVAAVVPRPVEKMYRRPDQGQ